jgi:hypothetical protein
MKKSRWFLPVTSLLLPLSGVGCGEGAADPLTNLSAPGAVSQAVTSSLGLDKASAKPVITAISPTTASNHGGGPVIISGRNFVSGAIVKIGGALATSSVLSSTTLTATVPTLPGTCGRVPVRVEDPSGQAATRTDLFTLQGAFGYLDPISYPTVPYASQVAVADFNLDGHLDLVVGTLDSNQVSFLAGRGDGTFRPAQNLAAGGLPDSVIADDFNQDGNLDLAVSDSSTSGTGHILLGKGRSFGGSQFGAPSDFTALEYIDGIRSADMNSDGKVDLVTFGDNSISVLLGKGDGTFQPHLDTARTSRPWGIAIGDLNGDGHPDVAAANRADNTMSILLGKGDGTFLTAVNYATDAAPILVDIKDVNHDGKLDVVTANQSTVSVFLGKGDGTFGTAQNYTATLHSVNDLAVRDLDDDGIPDIAIIDEIGSAVDVLIGKGDGSFGAPQPSTTGPIPNWLGIGDFDGDHRPDLVTTSVDSPGSVAVLLRECM